MREPLVNAAIAAPNSIFPSEHVFQNASREYR